MNACSPAPRTAMILAAGLGTRLRPLTDRMPKALVPFEGVPMIQRLMVRLREAGFTRAVINVHHFADMLEDFVRSHGGFGLEVEFSDERDLLRDTGGGIRHAVMSGLIGDEPVLVHNVDIVTSGIDLGRFFRETSGIPDASLLVSDRRASRYLLADSDGMLRGWVHPAKGISKVQVLPPAHRCKALFLQTPTPYPDAPHSPSAAYTSSPLPPCSCSAHGLRHFPSLTST